MEIWALDPNESYYSKDSLLYAKTMMEIKRCILLCADKDIYSGFDYDLVRWKLLSYHLRESFESRNVPMPLFANGKRLNEAGCLEFYAQMVERNDPEIKIWSIMRKEKPAFKQMKDYLGLEKIKLVAQNR